MKVKWLWAAFVSVLIMMTTFCVTIPANAKLHAVVEDSTTLVVLDSDSTVVFRKEMTFATVISQPIRVRCLRFGSIAIAFNYAAKDTTMIAPLPRACSYMSGCGIWRSHLLLIAPSGRDLLSADVPWPGVLPREIAMLAADTLVVLYADVGEIVQTDLRSGNTDVISISEKGCECSPEEPCLRGWMKVLSNHELLAARSDLGICGEEILSEVTLVKTNGSVAWGHEHVGAIVENVVVDSNHDIVILEMYYPVGQERYLVAVSRTGDTLWKRSLNGPTSRNTIIDAVGIHLSRINDGDKHSHDLILDIRTGEPVEDQP